ncbi:SLC13 family permease [Neoaquamicrobium sediminum]|uniref:SLC13 family permease n=1 Tax=Neoaquamicrobium sediminum TaxID=1849104 RepID=UPI001FD420AB|nr:SLC13 family permease [Mesorhizobium sediminum]
MMAGLLASYEAPIALGLVFLLFVMFVWEKYPANVTASAGAALFLVLGFVPTDKAMAVFSNSAPLTIGAMFVLTGALVRTGVLENVAGMVLDRSKKYPRLALGVFLLAALAASAFMNNTPVVLVLIPIVIRLAAALDIASTRLLIPISYAAILGGTLTLIGTSTNLLVDGVAREQGLASFSIFEITPVGLVAAATGIVTMLVLGKFLLPDRREENGDLFADGDGEFLSEVTVLADGIYTEKPIEEIADFNQPGVRITGVRTDGNVVRKNYQDIVLKRAIPHSRRQVAGAVDAKRARRPTGRATSRRGGRRRADCCGGCGRARPDEPRHAPFKPDTGSSLRRAGSGRPPS